MKKIVAVLCAVICVVIIMGCSQNGQVTQTDLVGSWQFNGKTDLNTFYKERANGFLSSMDVAAEIMKAGYLFLDGSYVEFVSNNTASFEAGDVEYIIEETEEGQYIKFTHGNGIESTHSLTFTKDNLSIDYFILEKVKQDTIVSPPGINMAAYTFDFEDLSVYTTNPDQKVTLGMSKSEIDQILGNGVSIGLYYDYGDGLEVLFIDEIAAALKLKSDKKKSPYILTDNIKLGDSKERIQAVFGEATFKRYSWEAYAFTVEEQGLSYLDFETLQQTNLSNVNTITFVYKNKKTEVEAVTIANYYYGYQYNQ